MVPFSALQTETTLQSISMRRYATMRIRKLKKDLMVNSENQPNVPTINRSLVLGKAVKVRYEAPRLQIRIDCLNRCTNLFIKYEKIIIGELISDFGNRSPAVTEGSDAYASIAPLKHARAHLTSRMKPEWRRSSPAIPGFIGAKAELRYKPRGVGIMSPGNLTVNLTFSPIAGVLAAGNCAMIKPSEQTPSRHSAASDRSTRRSSVILDHSKCSGTSPRS